MFEQLKVGSWACADDRCPIRTVVHAEDQAVTLVFGEHGDFELFVSATALQTLLQVGGQALEELNTRAVRSFSGTNHEGEGHDQ
ncbi:hypothetical protein ACFYTS_23710 [Nocardia sp. NPDC004151]|uniref:hypothetical protein n=1 Tax=Nocardia sp. NPDC004151 TaxID=3364304 RepID=UPI00367624D9